MLKLAKDIASALTSNVMSAVVQFSLQVFLVRLLGIEKYGLYVSAVALISFIELAFLSRSADISMPALSRLWFTGRYTEARTLAAQLEGQDAKWIVAIFLGVVSLTLLVAPALGIDPTVLLLLAVSIPAQAGYGVSKSILIISGAVRTQAKVEMLQWGCMFVLCLAGAFLFGVFGVIGGVVCTNVVKTLTARAQSRRLIPAHDDAQLQAKISGKDDVKGQTVQSISRNIFSGATEHTDTLLLSAMLGPAAAGTYRLAKSLASLPARAAAPMWVALRPRIARAWAVGNRSQQIKIVAWPAAIMLTAMAVAMPALWHYADRLVQVLYGDEGKGAAMPFLILLIGTWCYQGATAWYRVTMLMDENKIRSTYIFGLTWLCVAVAGGIFGRHSPLQMAYVVACSCVLASALCWISTFSVRNTKADDTVIEAPESQQARS